MLVVIISVLYGAIIASIIYFIDFSISRSVSSLVVSLIALFGIPVISMIPPVLLLKAPSFTSNIFRIYPFFFFFFQSFIYYIDPLVMYPQYKGIERLTSFILPMTIVQWLIVAFFASFVPQLAKACGYKLALDGSMLSFEVNANITLTSSQLNKLEEDFNLFKDKSRSTHDKLYFTKSYGKRKEVLQFFLRQEEGNKTGVVLVMHALKNDVPLRVEHGELRKIGNTLMTWLEVSGGFKISRTENRSFVAEIIQESKKSFYRGPFALPSKKAARQFLKDHWKDILIVVSILIAILAWLFPIR